MAFGCQSPEEKAAALTEEGRAFLLDHREKAALQSFEEALEADSTYAEAWYYTGNIYVNRSEYRTAILAYSKAIRYDSAFPEAWYNRGSAWFYEGIKDKACTDWLKAIELGKINIQDKVKGCES